ncbi:MAG TPA: chemotaxis protein CheR, partial [Exilispira sp.]|nr:chemotaxis protein CheR [Exilispira sp.]
MKLSEELFKKFTNLARKLAGITIKDYKLYLVESRLSRFVGEGKEFGSYEDLYSALISGRDKNLSIQFIQSLTTNYT